MGGLGWNLLQTYLHHCVKWYIANLFHFLHLKSTEYCFSYYHNDFPRILAKREIIANALVYNLLISLSSFFSFSFTD